MTKCNNWKNLHLGSSLSRVLSLRLFTTLDWRPDKLSTSLVRNDASIRHYDRELSSTPKKNQCSVICNNRLKCREKNDLSEDSFVISGKDSQNFESISYNSVTSNLPVNNDLSCFTIIQSDYSMKSGVLEISRFENCSITTKILRLKRYCQKHSFWLTKRYGLTIFYKYQIYQIRCVVLNI